MQFVGLLLIVNSLVGGAWWIASGRPQMVVVPICVAALSAGVYLMAHDRSASPAIKSTPGAAPLSTVELKELAQETAKARTLLADLQDQTAAADWHLKQLDEHIHEMRMLPDGRTRISNTVTGQPVVLIARMEALQKANLEKPGEPYALARECVGIYETTREQTQGVVLATGDPGAETIAWLYTTAATCAQHHVQLDESLAWARAAVATRPTIERQCLLVTALINKNQQGEADIIIRRELKAGGPDAAKFRAFLDQYKIPYKRSE